MLRPLCALLLTLMWVGTSRASEPGSADDSGTGGSRRAATAPLASAGPRSLAAAASPRSSSPSTTDPHERFTRPILETLRQHGVRAIFFVAGWRLKGATKMGDSRRAAAIETLRDGHILGNHTMKHARMCSIKREDARWELDENTRLIEEFTGFP